MRAGRRVMIVGAPTARYRRWTRRREAGSGVRLTRGNTMRRFGRVPTNAIQLCAAALLTVQAACATNRPAASASDQAVVIVANESEDQLDLWAMSPGVNSRRIGTVMSGETG